MCTFPSLRKLREGLIDLWTTEIDMFRTKVRAEFLPGLVWTLNCYRLCFPIFSSAKVVASAKGLLMREDHRCNSRHYLLFCRCHHQRASLPLLRDQ